jgi:hypothetical protein
VKKALSDSTLEAQARDRAATTGESYAKCYTDIYCSPENVAKRNGSITPVQKSADAAELLGEAHRRMHSLAVDHQRKTALPYARAYSHVYSARENEGLRNAVKRAHLASTMAVVQG